MPSYQTPDPIDVAITLQVGAVELIATDRADTVVTVAPTSASKAADRRGVEETSVDFDGRRLTIRGPRARISIIGPTESVDVRVELPTSSRVTAELSYGGVRTTGRLGATRIKAMTGPVDIDATADLWLRAGHGNATVGAIDGSAEVTADHGQIRIDTIAGDALLRASHGSIQLGEATGALDAKLSYGDLEVVRADASVTAKTAYGSIRLSRVSAGSIDVESGYGQVSVGVRPGVLAWLDLSTKGGRVRNELDSEGAPAPADATAAPDATVAVRARTAHSDISIQRAR
ncbi:DUF4097 family beta strand repeat-containing protein [Marisediminicola senii]|uniref:DUF4097 family beta strand repeat-containing protein n=1 Tax=Marisediminicola senii TaxID=2711233 RepID=UPI0013E9E379|nr:DUF4097 family beta strand repeat-containing protein [Marisediminicola senii]